MINIRLKKCVRTTQGTLILFPEVMLSGSQPTLTPARGDGTPLLAYMDVALMCTVTHRLKHKIK